MAVSVWGGTLVYVLSCFVMQTSIRRRKESVCKKEATYLHLGTHVYTASARKVLGKSKHINIQSLQNI